MKWFGWIWDTRRQRWERVREAEGLSACSKRLGEIVRARGTKDKYATMTGGAVPAFRPLSRTHGYAQEATSPSEAARPSSEQWENP